MNSSKTSLAAIALLVLTGGSAFAFNESSVNQADIARVGSQVDQIAAADIRAQAQNLVNQARSQQADGEHAQASFSLSRALGLTMQKQLAEYAK